MRNFAVLALSGLVSAISFTVPVHAAEIKLMEEIIAKVNGDIITRGELDRLRKQIETAAREHNLTGARLAERVASRDKDILRERIGQLVLIHKAKEPNINGDPECSKYLADIQRQHKRP